MKHPNALVCGAGGFIGNHLVKRLKSDGFWVRGVDLKFPEFSESAADDFIIGDLRDRQLVVDLLDRKFDEVYQLAADMGGAGYIFTGEHDADIMQNSASINFNLLRVMLERPVRSRVLLLLRLHLSRLQSGRSGQPELRRGVGLPGRTGQRIRMGEAFQRAAVPVLPPQSRFPRSHRPLPQRIRSRGNVAWRSREGAGGDLSEGCDGKEWRRDRDLGRWSTDPILYRG